jgi:DNA-binding TFAR19-related protein (PDSD5 family)
MDDIEEIRRRKIRKMEEQLAQRKLQEEQLERERSEVDRILDQVLMPDAVDYLKNMRTRSPQVTKKIEETVITLVVQRRLRQKIDLVIIKAIERKVRGIEPTISFQRKGKRMEISEKLRGED